MADKIRNSQQYLVTKAVAADFEHALAEAQAATDMHPIQQKAYIDAYSSQLSELREQIADYEEREGE